MAFPNGALDHLGMVLQLITFPVLSTTVVIQMSLPLGYKKKWEPTSFSRQSRISRLVKNSLVPMWIPLKTRNSEKDISNINMGLIALVQVQIIQKHLNSASAKYECDLLNKITTTLKDF